MPEAKPSSEMNRSAVSSLMVIPSNKPVASLTLSMLAALAVVRKEDSKQQNEEPDYGGVEGVPSRFLRGRDGRWAESYERAGAADVD